MFTKIKLPILIAVGLLSACANQSAPPTQAPPPTQEPTASAPPATDVVHDEAPAIYDPGSAPPGADGLHDEAQPAASAGPPPRPFPRPVYGARPPAASPPDYREEASDEAAYSVVRVFFATDRDLTGEDKPGKMFGIGRSNLSYGVSDIIIPPSHQLGELEAPSFWKLEFTQDPAKHVILMKVEVHTKDRFFTDLASRVHQSSESSAFLFIHGYNVSFEDAARRTGQMAYDLKFDGAPVFYSWPSQARTSAYTVDEQNIEWTETNLRSFLVDFFERSDAQRVYLIAHSMGNRALTRAVAYLLEQKPAIRSRLKEVILAAPDIDADVFKRQIAPALTATGQRVTLYASSKDLALIASKEVHKYPRAGDSGQGLVLLPGIETIDATNVETGFLGHSYFGGRSVVSDIFDLIKSGQSAENRFGLHSVDTQSGRYWEFAR